MNILVSLSENDKRLIFALLLVFILVFVLIGYIGFLITRVMKWQGKKLDHVVADPVVTRVITDKKHFTGVFPLNIVSMAANEWLISVSSAKRTKMTTLVSSVLCAHTTDKPAKKYKKANKNDFLIIINSPLFINQSSLRSRATGIPNWSRYLATVRRAMS